MMTTEDERRPGEEGAGGSGRKNKGKGKMTDAQKAAEEREREERERKALEQRRKEVMGRVATMLAAENEKIRDAQMAATSLTQVLSEMEELDTVHPRFAWEITPEPVADRFRTSQRRGRSSLRGTERERPNGGLLRG
jgi:hypothetical protein